MITTTLKKYRLLVLSISLLAITALCISTTESKATPFSPVVKKDITPHPTYVMRYVNGLLFTAMYNTDRSINMDSLCHIVEDAILFIDGKELSMDDFWGSDQNKTNEIDAVNVWEGKDAIRKFGKSGTRGVVEFFTKKVPV